MQRLLEQFEQTKTLNSADFEAILNSREKRKELISYFRNHQNAEFSRYLLRMAIVYRKGESGTCGCSLENLLMFSYFVSQNRTTTDFDLIMEAKLADFDTWCGFDGELIFYTLGYGATKAYLKNNVEKFSQSKVDYFLGFEEVVIEKEENLWFMNIHN